MSGNTTDDIMRCRRCGAWAHIVTGKDVNESAWAYVGCTKCGKQTSAYETVAEAVAEWERMR